MFCAAPLGLAIRNSAGRGAAAVWAGTDWQAHRVGVADADRALRELPPGLMPEPGRPKATGSRGIDRGGGCGGVTLGPRTVQLDGELASLGLRAPPTITCEVVAERCSLAEAGREAKAPDEADEANVVVVRRGLLLPKLSLGSQQLRAGVPAPLLLPSVAMGSMLLETVSEDSTGAVAEADVTEANALPGLRTLDAVHDVGSPAALCIFLMCCSSAATLSCCWRPKVVAFSSWFLSPSVSARCLSSSCRTRASSVSTRTRHPSASTTSATRAAETAATLPKPSKALLPAKVKTSAEPPAGTWLVLFLVTRLLGGEDALASGPSSSVDCHARVSETEIITLSPLDAGLSPKTMGDAARSVIDEEAVEPWRPPQALLRAPRPPCGRPSSHSSGSQPRSEFRWFEQVVEPTDAEQLEDCTRAPFSLPGCTRRRCRSATGTGCVAPSNNTSQFNASWSKRTTSP